MKPLTHRIKSLIRLATNNTEDAEARNSAVLACKLLLKEGYLDEEVPRTRRTPDPYSEPPRPSSSERSPPPRRPPPPPPEEWYEPGGRYYDHYDPFTRGSAEDEFARWVRDQEARRAARAQAERERKRSDEARREAAYEARRQAAYGAQQEKREYGFPHEPQGKRRERPDGSRRLRSKYEGTCCTCGASYHVGDKIWWHPQYRQSVHSSCPSPGMWSF